MSKQGNLKDISGKVYAQDPQGNVREVQPGDTIYEGELAVNDAGIVLTDAIHLAQAEQTGFMGQPSEVQVQAVSNADVRKEEKATESHYPTSTTSTDEILEASGDSVNVNARIYQEDLQEEGTALSSATSLTGGSNGLQESSDTVALTSDASAQNHWATAGNSALADISGQDAYSGTVTLKLLSVDQNGNVVRESSMFEGGMAYYKVVLLDSNGT